MYVCGGFISMLGPNNVALCVCVCVQMDLILNLQLDQLEETLGEADSTMQDNVDMYRLGIGLTQLYSSLSLS